MNITPVKQLVTDAKARITTIPLTDAADAHATPGTLFVDIRDIRELDREGRIPGAMHAPRGMLEFWMDPASPYHKPELLEADRVVLFCASAWRSALATATLNDMGATHVTELEGGFAGWRDAGLPVDAPAPKTKS